MEPIELLANSVKHIEKKLDLYIAQRLESDKVIEGLLSDINFNNTQVLGEFEMRNKEDEGKGVVPQDVKLAKPEDVKPAKNEKRSKKKTKGPSSSSSEGQD